MKIWGKIVLIFFIITAISTIIYFQVTKKTTQTVAKAQATPVKNVLYLSFCSVNTNMLPVFGSTDEKEFPNLSFIFNRSFIYSKSFTNYSWSNAKRFIYRKHWVRKYGHLPDSNEYFQEWGKGDNEATFLRIPYKEDVVAGYNEYFTTERSELPFQIFNELTEKIKSKFNQKEKNNIFMLHFKIMHYPYLSMDILKNSAKMQKYFTEKELNLINEYRENPGKYPEKFAFFQIAFGDPVFKKLYFNKSKQYFSYVTNVEAVAKWKSSANYNLDMDILKKAYKIRLSLLDELIGKFLNFYKTIESDTALIIGGDHGESIYEHDYLSHSFIPYDEVIRFFHAIHFPNQNKKLVIDQQISQSSIFDIVELIAGGTVNESNYIESHNSIEDDEYFFSQSCAGDVASLRVENKWKYIYFPFDEKNILYDLTKDPAELKDVSSEHPELIEKFKIMTLDRLTQKRAVKRVMGVLCY